MIPQAITNTGPYAGLWSDLKSTRHALERVMKASTMSDLAELDRARLQSLADFLRNQLDPNQTGANEFLSLAKTEPRYSLDADLRQLVKGIAVFEQWHRSGKLGFNEKAQKLIAALDGYVQKLSDELFPDNPPEEDFKVVHAILSGCVL